MLPSQCLVHPAANDDFVIGQNAPYGQVLVFPSQRLVHPAADDDFVIFYIWKLTLWTSAGVAKTTTSVSCS